MRRGISAATVVLAILAVVAGTTVTSTADEFRRSGSVPQSATGTTDAAEVVNDSAVRILVRYPTDDGYRNETLLTGKEFRSVGEVSEGRAGGTIVPVRLTDDGARQFVRRLRATGITREGVDDCRWEVREGHCLLVVSRGRVAHASGLTGELAEQVETGSFIDFPVLVFGADNESGARSIRRALLGRPVSTGTTTGESGPGGPVGSLPTSAVLIGSGLVLVVSALFLFGRRPGEGDESAESDPSSDGADRGSR